LKIGPTRIDDSFAEAFPMQFTRLIVTAHNEHWLDAAVCEFCGYSSSVIACDAEAGMEHHLDEAQTPDGRCGAALMAFGFSRDKLARAVANRASQCIMTCATTALYDGLPEADARIPLGKHMRFFGDGFQKSKVINGHRYWRVPVMDGEFVVSDNAGIAQGVAGGNIIIQGVQLDSTLDAAQRSVDALQTMSGVITPFPGGVARSGSKVGSRYKKLKASTADAFCPMLRGRTESKLHSDAQAALEIVIDGVSEEAVGLAMTAATRAAAGPGIVAITAGNYGGKLGQYQFHLRQLLAEK
jgi:formylmethanofuran--tetrahydromethanopterin N-formyltransferase